MNVFKMELIPVMAKLNLQQPSLQSSASHNLLKKQFCDKYKVEIEIVCSIKGILLSILVS